MSSRNLKWATYALYVIAIFNMYNVIAAAYLLANGSIKEIGILNAHPAALSIGVSVLLLSTALVMWSFITANRLKALKQTAWKHAMIISMLSFLDVYMIPVGLFVIYCLMDQNVRFLFKKESIRIGQ